MRRYLVSVYTAALLACVSFCCAAADQGAAAGMVLDLQGAGAQVIEGGAARELRFLARLTPGMRVELPAGSKLSLTLYATRSVYRFTGPVLFDVALDRVAVVQGSPPDARIVGEKVAAAAVQSNMVAGAYRMRRLAPLPRLQVVSPANGELVLDRGPLFAWDTEDRAVYSIVVQESPGDVVYRGTTGETAWRLPASHSLEPGKSYEWKVDYVSPVDGARQSATAKFSVAGGTQPAEVAALRPEEAAPVEDWVLYAIAMQQRNVHVLARQAWQHIAQTRPDLARIAGPAQ
jgi:hypothetical protein